MIHYQGRWAVVTGASSGLGRGFAAGLAARGMFLLLTGRNESRLGATNVTSAAAGSSQGATSQLAR